MNGLHPQLNQLSGNLTDSVQLLEDCGLLILLHLCEHLAQHDHLLVRVRHDLLLHPGKLLHQAQEHGLRDPTRRRDDHRRIVAILRGRGAVLIFDDRGALAEKAILSPSGPQLVAEIPAGAWHSLIALAPGTVWFEVKLGPYAAPPPEEPPQDAPGT